MNTKFDSQVDLATSLDLAKELRVSFFEQHASALKPALDTLARLQGKPFHNLEHTNGVVEATIILWCAENKVPLREIFKTERPELVKLLYAATYHDTGHVEGAKGHELQSVEVMRKGLVGFCDEQSISQIADWILATRMEKREGKICQVITNDRNGQILQDADLFHLGGVPFKKQWDNNCRLFKEEIGLIDGVQYEISASFIEGTIKFYQDHRYKTNVANNLLNSGKLANLNSFHAANARNMLALATI